VLTSLTGCAPEVAGGAALLVDPLRPDAIAEGIERVLSRPELREQLRAQGLARARQFSWERAANATLSLFERLAASRIQHGSDPSLGVTAG
jgi:glycosyltransferase involved in cell wall biosynthesis